MRLTEIEDYSPPRKFWYHPQGDRVVEVYDEHATDLFELGDEMGLPADQLKAIQDHVEDFEDWERSRALDAMEGDLLDLALDNGWVRGGCETEIYLHAADRTALRKAVDYFNDMYPDYCDPMAVNLNGVWDGWLSGRELQRFVRSGRFPGDAKVQETIALAEKASLHDLDPDKLYTAFKSSYEKETGAAWSEDKFLNRAQNWTFYGDDNGYVAVREQRSGMKKLVGVAGDPKSILKGLDELQAEGGPIWGAVSAPLAKIAKKRGMIVPHLVMGGPFFIKTLVKMIPASVFGGHEPSVTEDGGVQFSYEDVGTHTKYLIGNRAYFLAAMKLPQVAERLKEVPGLKTALKLMGLNESAVMEGQDADTIVQKHATKVRKPFNACKTVAYALARDLVAHGFRAEVLRCSGLQTPAPNADRRWLKLGKPFYWVHYVVRVGDKVYDLTRRQFFPDSPQPFVLSLTDLKHEWIDVDRDVDFAPETQVKEGVERITTWGGATLPVFHNPSRVAFENLVQKTRSAIRGLIDDAGQNVWLWDAHQAVHTTAMEGLGLPFSMDCIAYYHGRWDGPVSDHETGKFKNAIERLTPYDETPAGKRNRAELDRLLNDPELGLL